MKKEELNVKIDLVLRIILSIILLAVPFGLAIFIWAEPSIKVSGFETGLVTANAFLGIAEAIFLIRAAIFPRNGKRWWLED